MHLSNKSREQLISELSALQQQYNTVVKLYDDKLRESQQTALTLVENQANIKAIIQNSLDSIWSIDTNYHVQYVNDIFVQSFYETFGKKLSKGTNILEALPLNLREIWKERYDRAFNNEHFIFNDKIELANTEIYIEVAMNPVIINGKVVGASFFGKDVTSRRQAEESLKHSEKAMKQASENWNRTFQAMHSGIVLIDKNQCIIQTNRAFQNFLNKKEEMLKGRKLDDLIPQLNTQTGTPFKMMEASKLCETYEFQLDNQIFEVLFDPVFDDNMEINGAVFIMNNITQRKRDENIQHILYEITGNSLYEKPLAELLVFVRHELSKVIESTNFFVALHDTETGKLKKLIFEDEKDDFIEWDADKSLSGQVLKQKAALLLRSEDEARLAKENNIELLGSPAACWLGVPIMRGVNAIGVMVVQSYTNQNAYDNSTINLLKVVAHELSIVIERRKMIEDLVAAKEKAEESDRLKSAFLANVSHEIRTPMNGILGFTELIKQPGISPDELNHFVGIIEKSGERLLNIINDLINISKIESGQMDTHITETNINEQLEFLQNFFTPEAVQKGLNINVSYSLPAHQAYVMTDKEKLYAVLTNLIKNALKFTISGHINLGYNLKDNGLLFYVKDTGIGIPEHKQGSIFERFVQANIEHKSRYEGAGLGLAISKAYIEMLGGKIWVESEMGKGTTFYFSLPAVLNQMQPNDGKTVWKPNKKHEGENSASHLFPEKIGVYH